MTSPPAFDGRQSDRTGSAEEAKELECEFSSFLGEDLPAVLPMLAGWGLAPPAHEALMEGELAESLLRGLSSSLQPMIAGLLTEKLNDLS